MARTNKGNALVFAALGESFVFRQEAIAWVNGLRACGFGGSNDFVGHQIRLPRSRGPNQHSFVGQQHMAGFFVSFGVNSHCGNAHFLGGGNDTAGNLTAVGYQNFGKHIFFLMAFQFKRCRSLRLKRNVAVLAPWVFNFLVFQHDQ